MTSAYSTIVQILGSQAETLLSHRAEAIPLKQLPLPGPDFVDRIMLGSDRNIRTLSSLARLYAHGRLGKTGYLSILPIDQGVEHTAGASFAPNPAYFDPENLLHLAIEGGCSAIATTLGGLGLIARRFAHKIPLILKLNHNELLSYPNTYDQIPFASVQQAYDMGCVAIGATIYFGSPESHRQIQEVSRAFHHAHERGLATILWCYLRNSAFTTPKADYHEAADLTGQANYLGVTLEADLIKQKLPNTTGGFQALHFGKTSEAMSRLTTAHPIDLTRYQLLNQYAGRIGLINSGGPSGSNDLQDAIKTAVINKRAGGTGLIAGRKAFQKPLKEGIELLHAIQDVYLCPQVTIA